MLFISEAKAAQTQEATTVAPEMPEALAGSTEKMLMDNLMILGMLFFIFYFILIRPQQKRLKSHQAMLKELAKGNKVITSGGMIGTITKFEGEDVVQLEVAQGVKVRVARSAITDVMSATASESANDN